MATNDTTRDDGDDGDRRITSERDYRELINVHADGVEEAIEEDPVAFGDETAIYEKIHGVAANAYPSFNTGTALQALYYTHAEADGWREFTGPDPTWREAVQAMARWVIVQDLIAQLETRGRL